MIFNTSVTDYEGIKKVLSKQEEHDGRFDTVDADHSDIKALIASEVATAKSEIIAELGNVGGEVTAQTKKFTTFYYGKFKNSTVSFTGSGLATFMRHTTTSDTSITVNIDGYGDKEIDIPKNQTLTFSLYFEKSISFIANNNNSGLQSYIIQM